VAGSMSFPWGQKKEERSVDRPSTTSYLTPSLSSFASDHQRGAGNRWLRTPSKVDVTSAELARQLNASIYKVGLSLADQESKSFSSPSSARADAWRRSSVPFGTM
jgi:hypothetical protein